jgi:hypothetical protein
MVIEQTVEIPASHLLTLEIPSEIPVGRAKVELKFTSEPPVSRSAKRETAETLCGAAKGSKLTLERFMEIQRDDIVLESKIDKRLWTDKG